MSLQPCKVGRPELSRGWMTSCHRGGREGNMGSCCGASACGASDPTVAGKAVAAPVLPLLLGLSSRLLLWKPF